MDKERLLLSISRYDHYYDSINNKCNVFLTLNIFIVGGLVTAYPWLIDKVECGKLLHLNMVLLIATGMINIVLITWTSIPFLKKGSESLIYFGAVAELNPVSFARRSSVETEAEFKQDLRNQAFVLAKGLRSKFIKLKIVGYLFIAQFVLSIPLIINIINNFKSTK